jgi:hypothetical protein
MVLRLGNFKMPAVAMETHPIPSTIANHRWISIHNIIIYLETKLRPNQRIFVFGGHFVPWLPWQWPPFWICSTPHFDVGNWYPWFGSHIMIHFVGISTVVCGSFWEGLKAIQNGGRCHGNQDIKWPPNTKILRFGRNLHMPYNISFKLHPIPSTLNFSRLLWQRRPFWNF